MSEYGKEECYRRDQLIVFIRGSFILVGKISTSDSCRAVCDKYSTKPLRRPRALLMKVIWTGFKEGVTFALGLEDVDRA